MLRLLMALLVALPVRIAAADEADKLWSLEVQPTPRLGVAFPGSDTKYYHLMRELGIGIVRLSVSWKLVEPSRGKFRFQGLDGRVRTLQQLGLEPFLTFESNAPWATRGGDKVKNGTPKNVAEWTRFVGQVVERYDGDGIDDAPGLTGGVRYFQVANEFLSPTNRSGGWAGTHAGLLAYIDAAYDAVKTADPDAVFVLGGIASFNIDIALLAEGLADFELRQRWSEGRETVFRRADADNPQVQDLFRNRFKMILREARYDMAAVHLYGPEDRDAMRIDYMRGLSGRPVISTECGGPTLDYGGTYTGHRHYVAVLERNLNTWAAGAQVCLWFGLGEGIGSTWGNRRVQLYDMQARPKPGTEAYRLLARLAARMTGVTRTGHRSYRAETAAGAVCIDLADGSTCGGTTICVTDAESRAARVVPGPGDCRGEGVLLSGPGLLPLLSDPA